MPVPRTPNDLRYMLRESLPSISADGIQETVSTAIFLGSRLAGLNMTYPRLAPVAQLEQFLRLANVQMGNLGDPNGGRVYENFYPTTHGKPPCVPRDNWSCWVAANDTWEP